MSSIESLKEKARRHEQSEAWSKALELYRQAISKLEKDEQPDIGLYNRVGDLETRIGNLDAAAEAYEKAVDLYVDSELPNNAIAVCKKIIRNMPARSSVYLKMGQIRAEQGFLVDARVNFLTYAERVQAAGDMDEAFRALVEFADLAPEDLEVRLMVASQLHQAGRKDEAVEQLSSGYRQARLSGDPEMLSAFEEKLKEVDPSVDLDAIAAGARPARAVAEEAGDELPDFALAADPDEEEAEEVEEVEAVEELGFDIQGEEEAEPLPTFGEPEEEPALTFGEDEEEEAEPLPTFGADEEEEAELLPTFGVDEEEEAEPLPTFGADEEEEAEPLPTFGADEEEEAEPLPTFGADEEEEAEPLPTFGDSFEDEDVEAEEEPVLDAMAFGESDRGDRLRDGYVEEDEMGEVEVGGLDLSGSGGDEAAAGDVEEAVEEAVAEERSETDRLRATRDERAKRGDTAGALRASEELIDLRPDDVDHRQRHVELAFQTSDDRVLAEAYLGLARCLDRTGETDRARSVYQQVLSVDPDNAEAGAAVGQEPEPAAGGGEVASSEEYVDLGGLILDEEEEKTTRFKVAYEEPSGDEQADFARMLKQFKKKVSENVDVDDVKAHHDLGTAYKEMGLLDEAIEEFQSALRASSHHLPTYELLGQVFMEKGQPGAAVRSLTRALDAPYGVEDELVGIYYYLGRAHEELGNTDSAREFYDRVFSLDINFADVTERLRNLRS